MEALNSPIKKSGILKEVLGRKSSAYMWGLTRSARPLIQQLIRGDNPFSMIVTYDTARAEKLYQDYRFMDKDVYLYPAKDVLFYYADVHGNVTTGKRLEIIKRLVTGEPTVIITTVDGLMDKLPDFKYVKDRTITFKKDETVELDEIKRYLVRLGYENVAIVESAGQFSVRGGIIDIFPLTEECPCRIELFGDEIDSIRYFDVQSQRSIEVIDSIDIFPATEFVLSEERVNRGIRRIREEAEERCAELKSSFKTEAYARLKSAADRMCDELKEIDSRSGVDSLVSYLYSTTASFLSYLPEGAPIFIDEPVRVTERARAYFKEYAESMEGRYNGGYILKGQMDALYGDERIIAEIALRHPVCFSELYHKSTGFDEEVTTQLDAKSIVSFNGNINGLEKEISRWKKAGYKTVIVSPSSTRGKRLERTLNDDDITSFFSVSKTRVLQPREVMITVGNLPEGFEIPDLKMAVLSENDIFSKRNEGRRKKLPKQFSGEKINTLRDINVGDYVVHERHGIGVYRGIEQVEIDGIKRDYINIEYASNGKLFIPVDQLSVIGKYSAKDGPAPKLNKLGGKEWTKTRNRVKQNVEAVADELVTLYAIRRKEKGFAFEKDNLWQREFEEIFPYDETPDQLKAINDTKADMESSRIMDRLICGDVGFGKTEVAIRAAFKAVQSGKQVAYLVPTTILAEQHYETFAGRMKDYPIRISHLSRFCTPKQVKETLEGLKKGIVDVVIGTHRLLSKDVEFKDLGLLIIDEEQRFGVKHKESIKQMRKTVDVLTLTATPIPRTLHMSLIGVRDMSILEEAPVDRRPIQTYVMEYDREIVREAINRELARQGQVYYVYNRVDDIERITSELSELLPDAVIEYAHGRMTERNLERVMHRFINKEIDVLVSTTIIETGLDIPNVNTIIIHNADNFGLSQLYQLRGRVGRSDRSAYAFMLYRQDKVIKEVAEKRLSAIREFTDLGSGYKISMKDLEIRGAGNILGNTQSGHLEEVGYDLYVKMLNEAIKTRLGEKVEEGFDTTIEIPVDAYIPDSYVRNEYLKMELYKRIASIADEEDVETLMDEVRDRFGEPPKVFNRLIKTALIKAKAHKAMITDVVYRDNEVQYLFLPSARLNVDNIKSFIKKYKKTIRVISLKKSGFAVKTSKLIQEEMLDQIEAFINDVLEDLTIKAGGNEA